MELKHIEYFLALAEELNFSRAAQRLHITQPPLSRHIKALEDELNAKLFHRDTHTVRLTQEGQRFYEEAQSLFQQVKGVADKVKSAAKIPIKHINISFVFPSLQLFLPDLVSEFRKKHPHIQVDMKEIYDTEEVQQRLANQELDAAFLHPVLNKNKEVDYHRVLQEDIQLVVPKNHPLAQKTIVSHADLQQEEVIFFPREFAPTLYDLFLYECFEAARFKPNITMELTPAHARVALVAQNIGVTFAPPSIAKMFTGQVIFKEIHRTKPVILPIDLAWYSNTDNPHLQEFIRFSQSYLEEHTFDKTMVA